MTYVGAPMIYYGDEAGMWGATDPDERKPMLWPDLKYEDKKSSPVSEISRSDDKNIFNKSLFDYYRKLVYERESNSALTIGSYKTLIADNLKKVFVFERESGNQIAIVGFNLSGARQVVDVPLDKEVKAFRDVISSKILTVKNGTLHIEINSNRGVLLAN